MSRVGHEPGRSAQGLARPGMERWTGGVSELRSLQSRTLATARQQGWRGYSKHDALNAPWLEALAGRSRFRRIVLIQLVMRSPLHIRPWIGVRKARNAKGLALFARALLSRYRLLGKTASAEEARALLAWLLDNPSRGFEGLCWGYPYPWQDVGFYAPRGFPNRVVTSFVVHALVDGYETFGDASLLDGARKAVDFLLTAPRTLYEDEDHRCLSYVPSEKVDWIVMDVSALVGSAAAGVAYHTSDGALMAEAGRLIRYVVSKQTEYGAWYYSEPPDASHITHDNYHTGFILDSVLEYQRRAGSVEFRDAYRRGLDFYRRHLFEESGAPRFMSQRRWPHDIHGAAQGVITFALAPVELGGEIAFARRVLEWTIHNMYDPESGWFYYQKRRFYRTPIRLLRWCQAWMARAIGCLAERERDAA